MQIGVQYVNVMIGFNKRKCKIVKIFVYPLILVINLIILMKLMKKSIQRKVMKKVMKNENFTPFSNLK